MMIDDRVVITAEPRLAYAVYRPPFMTWAEVRRERRAERLYAIRLRAGRAPYRDH